MLLWQCSCGWAGARTLAAGEDVTEVRTKSGTTVRVHIELDGESSDVRKIS
jgi:hypothetical protein